MRAADHPEDLCPISGQDNREDVGLTTGDTICHGPRAILGDVVCSDLACPKAIRCERWSRNRRTLLHCEINPSVATLAIEYRLADHVDRQRRGKRVQSARGIEDPHR